MGRDLELEKLRQVRIFSILGLKDEGRKQFIRCPFHNESDASCVIYPDNSFHCYGCKAHGYNAIDFLSKLGAGFREVKEELQKYI